MITRKRFIVKVLVVVAVFGMCGATYIVVQQVLRQNANLPQIQLAEDAAAALSAGATPSSVVPRGTKVDAAVSLASFVVVYDAAGKVLETSGTLAGAAPVPPAGVFQYTREHSQDRITWQPRADVRLATVVVHRSGSFDGFVLSARSLREVERQEGFTGRILLLAALCTSAVALIALAL